MAIPEGFILVQSELFNRMRQHCGNCHGYNNPPQDLSAGCVVAPTGSSSISKKRKVSQSTGLTQNASINILRLLPQPETETTMSQLFSQQPQIERRRSLIGEPAQFGSRSKPRKEKGVKKPRTTLAYDRFIRNTPQGRWRERQLELGLNTVEKYERVIWDFPRHAHVVCKREYNKEPGESDSKLIVMGKKLAILTRSSLDNVDLQRSFAYFQVLILLSYCEFLRQKGVSDQVIDELIQTITDTRERNRKMLLDTIPWIHRLVVELVKKGWTLYRATELFFINAISISDLIWIRSDKTFNSILEYLSTDMFVKCNYDDSLTPNYTIPGLIASLFNSFDSIDQISLIELYNALGYNLPDLPSSVEGIYKVHPAKSVPVCPGSLEFTNLTHSCLVPAVNRNYADNEENENQSVANAQDPNRSYGGSGSIPGPHLQLPTQVKVPDTAPSIRFAMEGDIDGLKYLFSQRLASPRAVSNSRGFSLVRWALYGGMRNYRTVQFLLNCGAFVDDDSYQHVWDFAYRRKCSPKELDELRCITLNPSGTYAQRDWVEDQQFPLIHNIILGRSSKLLRAELDDTPDAVHVTDATGRTALDWATALAQLSNMRLLIDRGSPLNNMDVSGRTTILHAVDSHNENALHIILEAGANPNPEVPKGLFRSSPLTAASFGGLAGMIKLLIKFGAKVDACNPEGRTALQVVAGMQNVECADILLTHGADLGHISSNGRSPLTTAIIYNNHDVLKLFIDWCDTSLLKGLQLLPVIAEFADEETTSILASSDLLKQTLVNGDGFAAGCETLRSRTDYDEKLANAFEFLLRQGQRGGSRLPDGGQ